MIYRLVLLFSILIAVSCSEAINIQGAETDAEKMYKTGMALKERGDNEEAQAQFKKVITDYSYSEWEPYARIGLAESFFDQEEYSAALEAFRLFLTMRPGHQLADYVAFRIGACYFEQRPSDFFILPDPEEKDLSSSVDKAAESYRAYLRDFPGGKHLEEAKKLLAETESLLISRELKVAQFYQKQGRCPGVLMRLQTIKERYTVTSGEVKAELAKLEAACPAPKP